MKCLFNFRLCVLTLFLFGSSSIAFDNTLYDNVASYWGQNSYGAANPSDVSLFQQPLGYYCEDDAVDAFPIAFLDVFFGTGGYPSINLANTCNNVDNATFPGTELANCASLATDIEACQANGKIVTISLGGGGDDVGFTSDDQAVSFAQTVWDLFLGGTNSTRPFGDAVLDGVDLDIEEGGGTGYTAFVNTLRSLASGASKTYYVTAAPQCPYPDANLGTVLDEAEFDAVYVQFYNNQCGLNNYNTVSDWDFGLWDIWARNTSINPNVKIYLGAPASSSAAGTGYQSISNLSTIAVTMRQSFPSFGGVMLWDESQAFVNGRYDLGIKNALVAAGGTGFTYPLCSAPQWVSGTTYTVHEQVSYDGYIWEAKWWTDNEPAADYNGDWTAISACAGTGGVGSTTSLPATTISSTTNSPSATPTSAGNCASVAAWSSTIAYTAGEQVVYNGDLWTANWWTEGDVPGDASGSWAEDAPCTS